MQILFHLTQGLYLIHSQAVCNLHAACVSLKSAIFHQAVVTKLKGRVAKGSPKLCAEARQSPVLEETVGNCKGRRAGSAGFRGV